MIEPAKPSDAEDLRNLALRSDIDAWSIEDYSAESVRADSIVLKAINDERIIGFLLARIIPGISSAPEAEIYNIAVSSANRRSGIASEMFTRLLEMLREKKVARIWLEVRAGNDSAIAFYHKNGFLAEAIRPDMYANPAEDGLVMRCELFDPDSVNNGLDSSGE